MPNWSKSMMQTFEYYKVDPITWLDDTPILDIVSSSIDRDSSVETLGSASFETSNLVGECYIRVYLVTIQNDIKERFPLGTYLVQSPSFSFDGKVRNVNIDAYTPLIELKEKQPPLGFFTKKDRNILEESCRLVKDNLRAPVITTTNDETVVLDFVANSNDTWLSYISDLVSSSKHSIGLDELGQVIFEPRQETDAMAPTWIYTDDNSSILYPAVSLENDLFGIPNVVEVIYSTSEKYLYSRISNTEESSPISIQNRGREIIHRVTNPDISGTPTQEKIDKYAYDLLKDMSSLEYTITYTHGYCPTKVGDCVILNYKKSDINNVKARIISQSISCVPGTPVQERAIFTNKLWGD